MPGPNEPASYRVGTPYSVSNFIEELQSYFGRGEQFRIEHGGEVTAGDYHRLVVTGFHQKSGTAFQGKQALTLDVRFGAPTPTGAPAVFLRGLGAGEQASETIIGAKLAPGTPAVGESALPYELQGPARSLSDLIRASIESTVKTRQKFGQSDRSIRQEMMAIISSDRPEEYAGVRRKYNIPRGIQQIWGESTPGEQLYLSRNVALSLRGSPWERQNFARQTQAEGGKFTDYEQEFTTIDKMLIEGQLPGLTAYAGGGGGIYTPERLGEGAYQLAWMAEYRRGTPDEQAEWRGSYGLLWRTSPEKHAKLKTSREMSRSPILHPYVRDEDNIWRLIESQPIDPRYAGAPSYQYDREDFGTRLLSGIQPTGMIDTRVPGAKDPKWEGKPAVTGAGLIYPGEQTERQVLAQYSLLTRMPYHPGAGLVASSVTSGISGYAVRSPGKIIDMPYETGADLLQHGIEIDVGTLKGFNIGASREDRIHLGVAKNTPIELSAKPYRQQLTGATLVIPPFMMAGKGIFISDPKAVPESQRGNVESTAGIAQILQDQLADMGITVETTGVDKAYLQVHALSQVSIGDKGMGGLKQGATPIPEIMVKGAGYQYKIGGVIQETKQSAADFVSSWGLQPWQNKLAILEMIDPRLKTWAEGQDPSRPVNLGSMEQFWEEKTGYRESYIELFERALDKMRSYAPDSPENIANLKRFGMGKLPGQGKVTGGLVTQDFKEYQEAMLKAMGSSPTKAGISFKKASNGLYEYTFSANPESSFLMLVGKGMSAEWPGKGTTINADILAALNKDFPQFSKRMGLLEESGPMGGNPTLQRKSWLGVLEAYALSEAVRSSRGQVPTDRTKNLTELTMDQMNQLIESGMFDESRAGKTELEVMTSLVEMFGWNTLYFDKQKKFLPSPESILGIDIFDEALKPGESKAFYAKQYLSALKETLQYERGVAPVDVYGAYTSLMGGPESRFGRQINESKEIAKYIYGRDIGGAVGGHYSVMAQLNPGEAYMTSAELERLARTMGLTTGDEIEAFKTYINENKGAPGIFWRYPTISREHGVSPVRLVSPVDLAKRGVDIESLEASGPGTIYLNPFTPEPFIGDEDYDPHGFLIGLKPKWGRGKGRRRVLAGFQDVLSQDPGYKRVAMGAKAYGDILREIVGGTDEKYQEFSSLYSSLSEYIRDLAEPGKAPIDTHRELGLYAYTDIKAGAYRWQQIGQRRGTMHMGITAFQIGAMAVGAPERLIDQATKVLPLLYQQTLETTRQASQETPLETLAKTIRFRLTGKDAGATVGQAGRVLELAAAANMKPDERRPDWSPTSWTAVSGQDFYNWTRFMVKKMSSMDEVTNEALALGFANPGAKGKELEANYLAILQRLNESGLEGAERGEHLVDTRVEDLIARGVVSPYGAVGTYFLSTALARTFKKARELTGDEFRDNAGAELRRSLAQDKVIPWKGKKYTAVELMDDPQIKAFRQLYSAAYSRSQVPGESSFLSASDVGELEETLKGSESSIAKSIRGISKWLQLETMTNAPMTLGGKTRQDVAEELARGPQIMHISEIATLRRGKPEYQTSTAMRVTAKWIGNFLGERGLTANIFGMPPERQKVIDLGNKYEEWLAMKMVEEYRDTGTVPYTLVPRVSESEKTVPLQFEMEGITLLGTEDLIKVTQGPDGPVFHLREAKYGGSAAPQAGLQVQLYKEGYLKLARDNPDRLKEVLHSRWQASHEWYRAQMGWDPIMEDEAKWVAMAEEAIRAGRIETSVVTGLGIDPWQHGGYGKQDVSIPQPLSRERLGKEVKAAQQFIASRAGSTMRQVQEMLYYGKSGSEIAAPGAEPLPIGKANLVQQLLEGRGFFMSLPDAPEGDLGKTMKDRRGNFGYEAMEEPGEPEEELIPGQPVEGVSAGEQAVGGQGTKYVLGAKLVAEIEKYTKAGASHVIAMSTKIDELIEAINPGGGGRKSTAFYAAPTGETARYMRAQAAVGQYKALFTAPEGQETEYDRFERQVVQVLAPIAQAKGVAIPSTPQDIATFMQEHAAELYTAQEQGKIPKALTVEAGKIRQMVINMEKAALSRGGFQGTSEQEAILTHISELAQGQIATEETPGVSPILGEQGSVAAITAALGARPKEAVVLPPLTEEQQLKYQERLISSQEKLTSATEKLTTKVDEHGQISSEQLKAAREDLRKSGGYQRLAEAEARRAQLETGMASRGFRQEKGIWVDKSGAPLTEEQQRATAEQQRQLYEARVEEARALEAIRGGATGEGRLGALSRVGHGLRGIFGGFGMMYMMRTLGWGMQGLTQGFPEYEQYAAEQMRQRYAMYGPSAPFEQTPGLAMQQAYVRAGGQVGGALTMAQARMIGTPAGDIWSAAKGAFGVGLAGTFAAAELGITAGAALPIIGGAALLAGGGLMAAQQYGYAQRPDWSTQRAAGAKAFGGFGADYYIWGLNQMEKAEEFGGGFEGTAKSWNMQFAQFIKDLLPLSKEARKPDEPTSAELERDRLAALAKTYTTGGGAPLGNIPDIEKIIGTIVSNITETPFAPYSPDVAARAMRVMMGGGIGDIQAALQYSAQLQAGLPVEDLARQMAMVQRQLPTDRGFAQAITYTAPTEAGVMRQQIGVGAMGQFGNVAAQYIGLPYIPPEQFPREVERYAQYSQRPWWSFAVQTGGLAERAYQIGAQYTMPTPEELAMMTGPERMQSYAEYSRGAQAVSMGEQRAATLPIPITGYLNRQLFREGITGREFGAEMGAIPLAAQIYQMTGNEQAFYGAYQTLAGAAMQGSPQVQNILGGVLQGNAMAISQFYGGRGGFGLTRPFVQAFGMQAPVDVNLQGQVTGLPMYTSQISPQDLTRMFGTDWGAAAVAAAPGFGGGEMVAGQMVSGIPGIQAAMRHATQDYQMQQLQRAQANQALTRQYYLGGGDMGRGIWAVQDDLRALGISQQRWQFQNQIAGLNMQRSQFQENMALQARGMQMNQAFTREMWGFQDTQRQMQWGWRQEDFEEQRRFMTGRQRRLAERQMERETIMYGMTEEQIDKQREHQEELWQLEEERFELQKSHYEENYEFQLKQIEKAREYFEERTKLEQEQIDITRAYQLAQLEQSQANIDAQTAYNELMADYQDKLQIIGLDQQKQTENWARQAEYTGAIGQVLDDIEKFAKRMKEMGFDIPKGEWKPPKNIPEGAGGDDKLPKDPKDDDDHNIPQQHGLSGLFPGASYWVGEYEPELFRPLVPGTITPRSRWMDSVMMETQRYMTRGSRPTTLVVNLGNQRLGSYVIDTINGELEIV